LDMNITLKRSCFLTEETLEASFYDFCKIIIKKFMKRKNKFSVLYENGDIKGGWLSAY